MSVLNRIAHLQGRRDEVPNQRLAEELAASRDRAGIREIAANLWNPDPRIQADCVKVLYEIGYRDPRLVAPYAADFVKLLSSRNNRLIWGGMIGLSTVAALEARRLYAARAVILKAIATGSVITRDHGIRTLALVAAHSPSYRRTLFPYLLEHLQTCRSQDVPQHAESTLVAVKATNRMQFIAVLERRLTGMPASRAARIRKVIKAAAGV